MNKIKEYIDKELSKLKWEEEDIHNEDYLLGYKTALLNIENEIAVLNAE
tara:strand:+ start:854 stop:1000 length:147 start_codon:yes stop_codon:yes gene_type:complete